MHITMIAATSLDGKLTNGMDPNFSAWTSAEDKVHFSGQIAKHNLLVMGSNTYKPRKNSDPSDRLSVVLTYHPEAFQDQATPGKLEFTSEQPRELVQRLEQAGYSRMLLLGGSQIFAAFLAVELVDELLLTFEPLIFGSGTPLAGSTPLNAQFTLVSTKKLNDHGTMLLRYTLKRS